MSIIQTHKSRNRLVRAMNPRQAVEIIKNHWKHKKFVVDYCSFCGYPLGFVFERNKVFFDSGCFCCPEIFKEEKGDTDILYIVNQYPELVRENFREEQIWVI
jgi:hypothetical protein